jgi:flagellar motor switch protein FliN/FliY
VSWTTLTWRPLDATSLPAAAPLADVAGLLRSAVEEALSAARSAPVTIVGAEVAELTGTALPEGAAPIASVELVGAPRRLVLAAAEAPAAAPDGSAVEATTMVPLVLRAVDEAVAAVAGEGLGLGPADGATVAEGADLVALRLRLETAGEPAGALILAAEAAAVAELAAHVTALRALEAAGAETDAEADAGSETSGTEPAAGSMPAPASAAPGGDGGPAPVAGGPAIRPAAFPDLGGFGAPPPSAEPARSIDLLLGVQLQVSVEIGRARLPIREVLALAPGSIVELDKLAGEKADILVNGHPVAQGEVVVVDENFGVRITDVVSRQRRILSADGTP